MSVNYENGTFEVWGPEQLGAEYKLQQSHHATAINDRDIPYKQRFPHKGKFNTGYSTYRWSQGTLYEEVYLSWY